jgi:hypothetical protein
VALMRVLDRHDNAAGLIYSWLAHRGAHWRLLPVVGRRMRPKEYVP